MPLYEYQCKHGHRTERLASVADVNKDKEPRQHVPCQFKMEVEGEDIVCGHRAELMPSRTGTPILKAGKVGGFYKPNG